MSTSDASPTRVSTAQRSSSDTEISTQELAKHTASRAEKSLSKRASDEHGTLDVSASCMRRNACMHVCMTDMNGEEAEQGVLEPEE